MWHQRQGHNLFHTGSTHAHSYSPWRRVPFAPHLLQLWLLTDMAVRPNRTHVKDNIQPWWTPFSDLKLICCSMSSSNCCFLTCVQISQEAGQVVWYSHLFQNFLQFIVIHTVKGFGIVNKAEVDFFLEFSCFFDDLSNVGNLISGSSAFSKTSLSIWKFTVHVLLKPGLENFEHDFTSVWDECNCAVVWAFFGIAFLWGWTENWPVPVLWPLLSFPDLLAYWVQHF